MMCEAIIYSDGQPGCALCGCLVTKDTCPKCGAMLDWSKVHSGSGNWYRITYDLEICGVMKPQREYIQARNCHEARVLFDQMHYERERLSMKHRKAFGITVRRVNK